MKLLLTSNGLSNASIADALEQLVGKPRSETRIAFIPTSAFLAGEAEPDSYDWLADDMYRIKEFCGFIDVVSLMDLSRKELEARLNKADVIFIGGGNAFYISYCMEKSGLFDMLPELLKTRVYAGISAGSMIATPTLRAASMAIKNRDRFYDEEYEELGPEGRSSAITANLVNFVVRPHYLSKAFPNIQGDYLEKIAEDVDVPLYALDDNSAVLVDDSRLEIISEGEWKEYK